jgi:membrane-bound lytic murein transglycosylase B
MTITPARPAPLLRPLAALLGSLLWAAALMAPPLAEAAKPVPTVAPRDDDAPDTVTYGRRDDVLALAAEIAQQQTLDAEWVTEALAQARFVPAVAKLMQPPPPGTAKNWAAYRARFVEPRRIRAGVAFWQAHATTLQAAERRYGVPAAIVVGIVGVESIYGQQMGRFRVLDALATLSLDFPRDARRDRSAFFREELGLFLAHCRRQGLDPLEPRGSYAGAAGMPQFMPSALAKYAIDFDGDGHIDLAGSAADVIGSVAHYLASFGWQAGMPTHHAVAVPVDAGDRAVLLGPDILPSFTAAEFTERGARLDAAGLRHVGPMALVELQNGAAAPSYVAGTANFYAITRYNWSSYYAMAVIDLGQAVAAAAKPPSTALRDGPPKPKPGAKASRASPKAN